jgi:hypothetical protein
MSRNAVFITAHNDIVDELPYGVATWKYYCNKYNIDLIIYNTKVEADFVTWAHCSWKKWNAPEIISGNYERILMVDVDTMIRWDAPNIFDEYPDITIGLVRNQSAPLNSPQRNSSDRNIGIHHLQQWLTLVPHIKVNPENYANAGMILLTTENYKIISEKIPYYYDYWVNAYYDTELVFPDAAEQTPVNLITTHDIPDLTLLPYYWNNMVMSAYDDFSFLNDSYIWHFTGPRLGGWANKHIIMKEVYSIIEQFYVTE